MEVIQGFLINGFIKTTSQIKLALPIKPMDMIMVLAAQIKLNAEIACLQKVVGLKKELKYTLFKNMEQLLVNMKL